MLYQDHDHTEDAAPDNAPSAAAAAHIDPRPSQPSQPSAAAAKPTPVAASHPPSSTSATLPSESAAQEITTPLAIPGKAVVAKPAVAHNEPVLVGRVVSAESSAVRGAPPAVDQHHEHAHENDDDDADAHSDTASSSAATSNSFVGDVDKTELIFEFGRYVGQVDPLTGLRDGEGCLHYKSGNVYTGHWRDGAADGFGEKRYKNGDIYRGHWDQGKRSGRGAYLFAQGHFYDGMYANDQPEGYGIYTTLKGDRFAGHWKAGRKNGKGRETLVSGQVFVGNWRNGQKQGRGKLYLPGAEGYIYGIWNGDKFFRELTENEMGADGKEDVVDEFGLPRDASAPPVVAPWMKPAPIGAAVTDRVLMGVTALEDRMESLGKALERVMGGTNTEGDAASGGPASGLRAAVATTANAARSTAPPPLRFASSHRPTAEGVLASDLEAEEGDDEEPTLGVELRRPNASALSHTPPAALLSTAKSEEEKKEEVEEEEREGEHAQEPSAAAARPPREAPAQN